MGYKTTTIAKMMDGIEKRQIYLPAIQRKYVWKVEQIAVLMDSIMHDYPFGTFLFWRVEKEIVNKNNYVLYEFVNSYDERNRNDNKPVTLPLLTNEKDPESAITAVLDGQQRLTSLCIALRGGIIVKTRRRDGAIPYATKELYFDLLTPVYVSKEQGKEEDGESAGTNAFDFLTREEAESQNASGQHHWYKVKDIVGFSSPVALNTQIRTWDEIPAGNLIKLYQKVNNTCNHLADRYG